MLLASGYLPVRVQHVVLISTRVFNEPTCSFHTTPTIEFNYHSGLYMGHDCVNWSATPPTRKAPFLVFSYGGRHSYAAVPKSFNVLEETARRKFSLGLAEIELYSSCGILCGDVLAKIDEDVWELVAPCIGHITVIQTTPSAVEPIAELQSNSTENSTEDSFVVLDKQTTLAPPSEDYCNPDGDNGMTYDSHGDRTRMFSPVVGTVDPSSLPNTVASGSDPTIAKITRPGSPAHDNPVTPLPRSPNRWIAPTLDCHDRAEMTACSPERAKRRFTGLLNKVTRKNLYFICDKMLAWIDGCHQTVQGKVLELACRLLFDRAINELERMGLYISLCGTMARMIHSQEMKSQQSTKRQTVTNYQLMVRYMTWNWKEAFEQKSLSWGQPIRGSIITKPTSIEQHYEAEKQKRRGIGFAGFTVELIKLNLLHYPRQVEPFFQELAYNLEHDPKEGDVVSLCILLQNVTTNDDCWRHQDKIRIGRVHQHDYSSYKTACSTAARKLAGSCWGDNGISPRLRCRLLDLADSYENDSLSPNCHGIAYNFAHDQLRYSIPEASAWCTTRVTASPDSPPVDKYFMLVDHVDHWWFIRSLVTRVSNSNAGSIGGFLARALQMSLCSLEALEEGLVAAMEALDAAEKQNPEVYCYMGVVMKDSGFYKEEERFMRVVKHAKDAEKLIQLTLW